MITAAMPEINMFKRLLLSFLPAWPSGFDVLVGCSYVRQSDRQVSRSSQFSLTVLEGCAPGVDTVAFAAMVVLPVAVDRDVPDVVVILVVTLVVTTSVDDDDADADEDALSGSSGVASNPQPSAACATLSP